MKNRFILLFRLLFLFVFVGCSKTITSPGLYKKVSVYDGAKTHLTLDSVLVLANNNSFFKNLDNKVLYELNDKKEVWLYIKEVSLQEQKYFSIWNPYLDYSKLYIQQKDSIIELNEISLLTASEYNSIYRFPSWKLPILNENTSLILKIRDTKRATGLKFLLQNEKDFLTFVKIDYYKNSFFGIMTLSLLIIVISLFIARKEFVLILYAFYIITFILEYFISMGLDMELNLISSPILHATKKILLQAIGGFFVSLFFLNYYKFSTELKPIKKIFTIANTIYLISVLLILSFIVIDNVYLPKIYIWIPQRVAIILILLSHFYLVKKQKIPLYLGISFTFPILGYFAFALINYKQTYGLFSYIILENIFYIAILLEITFMIYFIINQLVKSEFIAIKLSEENANLKTNFQTKILQIQEKERTKLLSNVHDSFGGYLEALKIRLLQKNNNSDKIQEILDAFYKDYRYLLNNLYAPKINASNFTNTLKEFIDKINAISNNLIHYTFTIEQAELSSEKCIHIYRIVSELITNAIKHANASEIQLHLYDDKENNLCVEIKDNGIGFNADKITKNSYGINNITSRVKENKGSIDISSKKNLGTRIQIKIPKNEN